MDIKPHISLTLSLDDRQALLDIYNELKRKGLILDNPKHPGQPSLSAIIHHLIQQEVKKL